MKVTLSDMIFWLLVIFSIILVLWNVFGNSPTEYITFVTLIIASIYKMNKLDRKLVALAINLKHGIQEMSQLKTDVHGLKSDVTELKINFNNHIQQSKHKIRNI